MKTQLLVFCLSIAAATAQTAPGNHPAEERKPITASLQLPSAKPPQRDLTRVQYSGALVQVAHTRNPVQLINPRAPRRYGDGWANVATDPVTNRAHGIKLLSITF